jgi:hypothetical protein
VQLALVRQDGKERESSGARWIQVHSLHASAMLGCHVEEGDFAIWQYASCPRKLIRGSLVPDHQGFRSGQEFSAVRLVRRLTWQSVVNRSVTHRRTIKSACRTDDLESLLPNHGQTGMYGPPPCCKRKVRVTGWSTQMYTAFVGATSPWPGWNALRSLSIQLGGLGRLLPVTGFESAGFDRCAISLFASRRLFS